MTAVDWAVLVVTIGAIVGVGIWRTRAANVDEFLRSGNDLPWHTIGLSVMATQASAITFLSVPGLAFEEGMGFVQFYFGQPLALIVVCAVFVPIFYRLNVFTAYEYLERRFDVRVRTLGALLFLVQRGLAAGITIYAPSIILATILDLPLHLTNLVIGVTVVAYTVTGGSKAVSQTQKHQMVVILLGMVLAGVVLVSRLPRDLSIDEAASIAGATGRMTIVDTSLRWDSRYNLWSGLAGGFFLALSYFGTDQSQVQRYLGGTSSAAGRMGLLFNGMFKIPMQFLILFLGVLLYVFYVFSPAPAFFNPTALEEARAASPAAVAEAEGVYAERASERKDAAEAFVAARRDGGDASEARAKLAAADAAVAAARAKTKDVIVEAVPGAETKDADFVFISFVLAVLPTGLVGLLVAVILLAAMSSIAGELSALATTSTVDLYQRLRRPDASDAQRLTATKVLTVVWGLVALGFASVADLFDNLIEAVNVLGSLFYGTVLGLFVVAFFTRRIGATAVFWGALVAEAVVVVAFFTTELGFLWFNVIGCGLTVAVAGLLEVVLPRRRESDRASIGPW
ncbi:MAG: sodium:solute symporter [Myxococcales bacterium]|nr:sodium:solute symporter [Myxococcales bacterium]